MAIGADTEIRDVRAWLYRIVHNAAVSQLRRPRLESVDAALPAGGGGVHDEFERRVAVREALAGLAALPALQREVMLSTALDGSSHDEVASELGLSHGAVRGLIYRARATLRAAAAALIPGPVVDWAARQEVVEAGAHPGALLEALTGGGSAGIGGLLLKGGAVVMSAGALATAAGVGVGGHTHHLGDVTRAANLPAAPRRAPGGGGRDHAGEHVLPVLAAAGAAPAGRGRWPRRRAAGAGGSPRCRSRLRGGAWLRSERTRRGWEPRRRDRRRA